MNDKYDEHINNNSDNILFDKEGNSSLHKACQDVNLSLSIIRELLEKKADPNIKNAQGDTPFHILCMNPKTTIEHLQCLIEYKADIHAINYYNMNALNMICFSKGTYNFEIFSYLLEQGVQYDLQPSAHEEDGCLLSALAKRIKKTGFDGNWKIAKAILKKGIDCQEIENEFGPALHFACLSKKNDHEMIELLIKNGSDPKDMVDDAQNTCLHALANNIYHLDKIVDLHIVDILLNHGVDINHKNDRGETSLYMALEGGNYTLALYLILHNACVHDEKLYTLIKEEREEEFLWPNMQTLICHMQQLTLQDTVSFTQHARQRLLNRFGTSYYACFEGKEIKNKAFTLLCALKYNKNETLKSIIPPKYLRHGLVNWMLKGADENECIRVILKQWMTSSVSNYDVFIDECIEDSPLTRKRQMK